MSLFSSNTDDQGIAGPLRDCTPGGKGRRKLQPGDIAIIDAPDISYSEAQELVDAKPAAIVNIAAYSTGSVPNYGPQALLDSEIPLLENVDKAILRGFKDGAKKGNIGDDGIVYNGERKIGGGDWLHRDAAETSFEEAQSSLISHMDAFFGNTTEFVDAETPLLVDGLGIPNLGDALTDRKVLVVSPTEDTRSQIRALRNFIREYHPVIIGVEQAADELVSEGYHPELIVGDPTKVQPEALRTAGQVILPADPDGHAAGLERIQDLGIGATTFPVSIESPTELALLLAQENDAAMIVNAGAPFELEDIFAHHDYANPGTLLTRLKAGPRLVDASMIAKLYSLEKNSSLVWLWAVLGLLVALAVIILVAGLGGSGSFENNLIDTWNAIALKFQSLFK